MNRIVYFILALCLFFSNSCSDTADNSICSKSGDIVDYVAEKCLCCPGWLVTDGVDTLKFLDIPDQQQLWDLVNFYGLPLSIKYNYAIDNTSCSLSYKVMTCIDYDIDMSCTKSGEIIDYISIECMCCPGWIIKVGCDTIKVPRLPIESNVREIVQNSGFPIHVRIDYEDLDDNCAENYKKLLCIELID